MALKVSLLLSPVLKLSLLSSVALAKHLSHVPNFSSGAFSSSGLILWALKAELFFSVCHLSPCSLNSMSYKPCSMTIATYKSFSLPKVGLSLLFVPCVSLRPFTSIWVCFLFQTSVTWSQSCCCFKLQLLFFLLSLFLPFFHYQT